MTQTYVSIRHVRKAKMCCRGARAFCARHGLDWRQLREGTLPVEQVEGTGDAMAERVAAVAREDAGDG